MLIKPYYLQKLQDWNKILRNGSRRRRLKQFIVQFLIKNSLSCASSSVLFPARRKKTNNNSKVRNLTTYHTTPYCEVFEKSRMFVNCKCFITQSVSKMLGYISRVSFFLHQNEERKSYKHIRKWVVAEFNWNITLKNKQFNI